MVRKIAVMVTGFLAVAGLAGGASAAVMTVGSATATTNQADPGLATFTSTTGSELPKTFTLTNVGNSITFLTLRYFTNETSASEPDDAVPKDTTMTLNFTAPESKMVTLTGTTDGGNFGTPIAGVPTGAGRVRWSGPAFVTVGGLPLRVQATDTIYNNQLFSSTSGEAFGANVPVTVTVVPEPASAPLLVAAAGVLLRRRRD